VNLDLAPIVVFGILLVIAAGGYHAVTEHHVHLRILHLVNPRVEVPETRHDSRWHAMGHGQRALANTGMIVAAACLGVAWRLAPGITTICVTIAIAAAAAALLARAVSKALGQRHGTDTDLED